MPVLSPLSFSRYFINVTCEQVVIKNTVFKIWLPFPFYNVILCDYKTVTTWQEWKSDFIRPFTKENPYFTMLAENTYPCLRAVAS